jgi:hypothetical protein
MSSNAINDLKTVPQTFSSWDKCMQKSFCKYPAIVGIIVAVLIAISLIWCCVRCCCCGLSCCCGCFSCFNRCCPGGRGRKRSKYAEPASDDRQPNPYNGYIPPPYPPAYQGPNTATFDVPGRKVNGDSLPAMPTWAEAQVQNSSNRDDVEMGHIARPAQASGIVPLAGGRANRGGYRELSAHEDSAEQPAGYRGTSSTHPYGSDLGAQSMTSQRTGYDQPGSRPATDRFQTGASAPAPYARSSPPQPAYAPYTPNLGSVSGQARPPSLLQAGRKPVTGSLREI